MNAQSLPDRNNHPVYAFLDLAPNAVLVVTADGLIDYVNPVACEAFGYQAHELIDQPVERLVPSDLVAAHVELRSEFMAVPLGRPIGDGRDVSARRKDGTVFPAEISLTPVEWNGRALVVTSVIDITRRVLDAANLSELIRLYLTLARMNQAIVRAPDALALFAQTCQIAVEQGGYKGAWVAQRGNGHTVRCVASAGALDEYVGQLDVSADAGDARGRGPTGRVMREGTSYYGQDFLSDEATLPWHHLGAEFGINSTATLPLRCAGRVVATLTLYSGRRDAFTDEVRTLLDGVADNVSAALDTFDGVAKLHEVALQRTELARRLVEAQEVERSRIAADVHDDSVQALAAVDLRLGLLQRQVLATAPPEVGEAVEQLRQTVGLVSAGLRDLLFELEPAGPDSHLLEMLQEAATHVFADTEIRCSVTADFTQCPQNRALSRTDRGQALRIVKEAMLNARKHSGASLVSVKVTPKPDRVDVEVTDNGTGFHMQESSAPGHRGLANMLDRALVSGGRCRVSSDEGGTCVRFWMPYDESTTASDTFSEAALRNIAEFSS